MVLLLSLFVLFECIPSPMFVFSVGLLDKALPPLLLSLLPISRYSRSEAVEPYYKKSSSRSQWVEKAAAIKVNTRRSRARAMVAVVGSKCGLRSCVADDCITAGVRLSINLPLAPLLCRLKLSCVRKTVFGLPVVGSRWAVCFLGGCRFLAP